MHAFAGLLFALMLLLRAPTLAAEPPRLTEVLSGPDALWTALEGAREVSVRGQLPYNREAGEPRPILWVALPCTMREPTAIRRLTEFLRSADLEFDADATAMLAGGSKLATSIYTDFTVDGHASFATAASDLVIFAGERTYRPAAYRQRQDTNFSRELALLLTSLGVAASTDRPQPPAP